ncbi:hypothetical protein DPMN_101946 [Dreissena polymorpha]|uniref:Uncharacterized protein n=1 Tax=Dreissena polymorpha TaxID=45954 RepID=A0A9D4RAJ4_DREPO|nr:hypothetical protein DPMN_101946 [Dreissena polymorpha]
MGHESSIKYIIVDAVAFYMFMTYVIRGASWVTVQSLAYYLGGGGGTSTIPCLSPSKGFHTISPSDTRIRWRSESSASSRTYRLEYPSRVVFGSIISSTTVTSAAIKMMRTFPPTLKPNYS